MATTHDIPSTRRGMPRRQFLRGGLVLTGTMLAGGLRATLCCVDTTQLDAGFAGRDYDTALLDALPAGVDPCGENGEFHTVVHAGPMFATAIVLQRGDSALDQDRFQRTTFTLAG